MAKLLMSIMAVFLVGYVVEGHRDHDHRDHDRHHSHINRRVNTRVGPQFSTKGGSCPSDGFNHMTGIKQCHGLECLTDNGCPGERLCCWYHCGYNLQTTVCKLPVGSQLVSDHQSHHHQPEEEPLEPVQPFVPEHPEPVEPENPEPAICPFVTIRTRQQCQQDNLALQNQCNHDSDCSRGKLCCSNGCPGNPLVCALAEHGTVMVKEGNCPSTSALRCHPNRDRCVTDENCPNNKKCCAGPCGAGLVCTRPAEAFRNQQPVNSRRQRTTTTTTTTTTTPQPVRNVQQLIDQTDEEVSTTSSTSSTSTTSTTTTPLPTTTVKKTTRLTTPLTTAPTSPSTPSQQEVLQLAQNKISEILGRRFG